MRLQKQLLLTAFIGTLCFGPLAQAQTGLVAAWPAEGSGAPSAGDSTATLLNGVSFGPGHTGQAFVLDGFDDQISFGNTAGNLGTNNFSISYWLKTTKTGLQSLLEKRPACNMNTGTSWWGIRGSTNQVLEIAGAQMQHYKALYTIATLNDGAWHHVVWTRETTTLHVYVDGALNNSITTTGVADIANSTLMQLGSSACNLSGSDAYEGFVDELEIFNRALSGAEVQAKFGQEDLTEPAITTHPISQTVIQGITVTFHAEASGAAPLTFQWRLNGTNIQGANASILTINDISESNEGDYSVVVTNNYGIATSSDAVLTVVAAPDPSSGAIGWWPADGSGADMAGNTPGTLQSGVSFVVGKSNQAFSFDGVDDRVTFAKPAGNFGTSDFTIAYWMKTTSTGGAFLEKRPACNMDSGASWWGIRGTGTFGLEIAGSRMADYTSISTVTSLDDGAWHHVAWTRQGTTLQVYVDGALNNSKISSGVANITNNTAMRLGASTCTVDGTQPYRGAVDELRIFNRALSSTEIYATFNEGNAGPPVITLQPASRNTYEGNSVTFTVVATGAQPLQYQWRFNGANASGATESAFTLSDIDDSDEGTYVVVLSNSVGSVTSTPAQLTMLTTTTELPPGLVAWWPAEGDANDIIGNNHGVPSGVTFTPGQIGQAFELSGAESYVDFGPSIGDFGTNNFTIACWMRTSGDGRAAFLEKRPACNMDWGPSWWGIRGTVDFVLEIGGAKMQYYSAVTTAISVTDGEWHHLVWTREGKHLKVYVDGSLNSTNTTPGIANITSDASMQLGTSSCNNVDGTTPFTGSVDELQIYNRALSSSEILAIYGTDGNDNGRAPVIVLQPKNQRRNQGKSPTFKVAAVGSHPLAYQWQLGGVDIPEGNDDTFVTENLLETNSFRCIVSNPYGIVTSAPAYILYTIPDGNYTGLFYEEEEVQHERSGLANIRINRTGSFSGTLSFNGVRRPFTGKLTNNEATVIITRTNETPVSVSFNLLSMNEMDMIGGTISRDDWTAQLTANRVPFNSKNPAPQSGKYTLAMRDEFTIGGPKGNSFGALTVTPSGLVSISGLLSDDARVTQSIGLSGNGEWPLYAPIYRGTGSVLGWLTFTNTSLSSVEGNVNWVKKGAFGKHFPAGFTNIGEVVGSTYLPPTNRAPINVTNAIMEFTGEGLNLATNVQLKPTTVVTVGHTNYQICTINPRSGLFQGTVVNPASGLKIPFRGALLQQQTNGIGYFLRTNIHGDVTLQGELTE